MVTLEIRCPLFVGLHWKLGVPCDLDLHWKLGVPCDLDLHWKPGVWSTVEIWVSNAINSV
jgi:hypothetical protein